MTTASPDFKTTPFPHQLEEHLTSRDHKHRFYPWEMGVAKTKPALDTAAHLYRTNQIKGLLVVAPNGVHQNWVLDEIPIHMPDDVAKVMRCLDWQTKKAKTKWFQKLVRGLMDHEGFTVLALSYDAIMTEAGRAAAKEFLNTRTCLYVLDESQYIKAPSTKRAKRILASGKHAEFRRTLSGTPITNTPFDLYTQCMFLVPTIWHQFGIRTFAAFKAYFGVWQKKQVRVKGKLHEFMDLVTYKNLDKLTKVMDSLGKRILKSEALPHLPPKLYSKRYFEMTPEQWRAYRDIQTELRVYLAGGQCTAKIALSKILRMQQITSGYLPNDDDDRLILLDPNPKRLQAMAALLDDIPHQAILWAKYVPDIDMIMQLCKQREVSAVRYDGSTSVEDRLVARRAFQAGEVQFFVANPAAAGEGLTLHAAETVVYYNTTYKMAERLQSEDRAHRAGMPDRPVNYIDLIAENTIDNKIIGALRRKKNVADIVLGDEVRDWI